jgi:hypothetical protein
MKKFGIPTRGGAEAEAGEETEEPLETDEGRG